MKLREHDSLSIELNDVRPYLLFLDNLYTLIEENSLEQLLSDEADNLSFISEKLNAEIIWQIIGDGKVAKSIWEAASDIDEAKSIGLSDLETQIAQNNVFIQHLSKCVQAFELRINSLLDLISRKLNLAHLTPIEMEFLNQSLSILANSKKGLSLALAEQTIVISPKEYLEKKNELLALALSYEISPEDALMRVNILLQGMLNTAVKLNDSETLDSGSSLQEASMRLLNVVGEDTKKCARHMTLGFGDVTQTRKDVQMKSDSTIAIKKSS